MNRVGTLTLTLTLHSQEGLATSPEQHSQVESREGHVGYVRYAGQEALHEPGEATEQVRDTHGEGQGEGQGRFGFAYGRVTACLVRPMLGFSWASRS